MMFSVLEDTSSKIEVVVFPTVLSANPEAFQENRILVVSGKLNYKDGVPKFLADDVRPVATLS
jgi:DNA polymerase III alpha subunit